MSAENNVKKYGDQGTANDVNAQEQELSEKDLEKASGGARALRDDESPKE